MWCGLELLMFFGLLSVSQVYFSWFYTLPKPGPDQANKTAPLVCYFAMDESWPNNGTLHPALNATLCSHILFIGTGIVDCQVAENPDNDPKYFGKIPLLRQQNPSLKVLFSSSVSRAFSPVLESAANRTNEEEEGDDDNDDDEMLSQKKRKKEYRCTHILFIATTIKACRVALANPDDGDKYLSKIPLLRQQNPSLKLLFSNGGGGSNAFSPVLESAANRTKYVNSIFTFMKKYDLDGVDLDWEFPGWGDLPREQRKNFTLITQQIRRAFDAAGRTGKQYLLTAAVAAGRSLIEIYDIPALGKSLDWINLMCYDMHTYNELWPVTDYNSPLYPKTWRQKLVILAGNIGWSTNEWHVRGMPKEKIVVGLPTYAHGYTLEFPERYHGHYAPATGIGKYDFANYTRICGLLKSGATRVWDEVAGVPYAYKGDQWVSYDDVQSLTTKTAWVIQEGYGGIMVFSMNADDYTGACGTGRFPLLSAIQATLNKTRSNSYQRPKITEIL